MKKYFSICIFGLLSGISICLPSNSQAQKSVVAGAEVSGHIQDSHQAAVPFAAITLRKSSDSSLIKGSLTDTLGNFHLSNIQPGNYLIKAGLSNGASVFSQPFQLTSGQKGKTLPDLTIDLNSLELKETKVRAAKPLISYAAGKTTVNVANSSLSTGNTVFEVLEKSPGVLVDQNDNILLNGKTGVNIMINGRPTNMAAAQLATLLKGMLAASVSKIELMNQPPAKYSAAGSAGIINIALQKQVAMGLNGSINTGLGYGPDWKYNGGGNLNYRGKSVSVYGSYNFDHKKTEMDMDISRQFFNPSTDELESTMDQTTKINIANNHHNAQVGMDYFINPKQSIGFVANGDFNKGDFYSHSPVNFKDAEGHIDSISTSTNHNGYNWKHESGNLHYDLKLDDKGSNITVNTDYSHFYQNMPQAITTQTKNGQGENISQAVKRRGKQPNDINIYAAKVDYMGVFKNNYQLEAGLKTNFVNTQNQSIFDINRNGLWQNDPGLSNRFNYRENINAAYLTLSKTFEKGWSAKVGARAEQTNVKTHQLIGDSTNSMSYLDLFPNVSLSKSINPNNVLSLSFSRRIDRPNYQSLNPFVYYVNEYTYRVGNPYLKPQYTRMAELDYTFKRRYALSLSYSHTKDIISEVVTQDDLTHNIYQSQGNINKLNNLTLGLNVPVKITPWWQTYNSAQLFYNQYKGLYNGYPLDKGYASFMVNTYQSFLLPENWKAELSGMYRSTMIMGPFEVSPMVMVSAGISKSLWHGKADIKVNVQDIFQSMNFKVNTEFGNLHIRSNAYIYNRSVNLTFSWHFGNQKVKVKKHKDTGIQDAEKRIQKGAGGNKL